MVFLPIFNYLYLGQWLANLLISKAYSVTLASFDNSYSVAVDAFVLKRCLLQNCRVFVLLPWTGNLAEFDFLINSCKDRTVVFQIVALLVRFGGGNDPEGGSSATLRFIHI